ncbi:MAG: class I SAM-dependent methyltransferase, partial [Chloroflexi bacterium]|nr:class I SAM-dependent methyltransferase [Chloroflexota bacterium]
MKARIVLKPGKDKPVLARHPWIFSGAIARVEDASDGDTVDIFDSTERWIARGYFNARSQIAARVWTWNDEPVDRAFLCARLERAFDARRAIAAGGLTNGYRLVNAESDLLPGLIVDRYADFVVLQFLTLGVEKRKAEIAALVTELAQPRGIYERSDVDVRLKEGLATSVGVVFGATPPDRLEIRENGMRFWVDVQHGHKTGFYLDQRENRARVARLLADYSPAVSAGSGETLNVFSFTGAFAVYLCAANPNERVINLDASREALTLAQENMALNGLPARAEFVEGDAFQMLRRYRDAGRSFDAIILDPPKFVHSQAQM